MAPVALLNVPGSQTWHLLLPGSEDLPASQFTHFEDPSSSDLVFAAQRVQFVLKLAPWCGFFFPAAHLLHLSGLVKPVADEYRPSGHPMQALLETAPI